MESSIINNMSKQLQIAPEFIVREYWEMVILQELANSPIGPALIFKGGTALRLAYNSPRFSVDLDFSLADKIDIDAFRKVLESCVKKYPSLTLVDVAQKFYTLFAQIKIVETELAHNFSVKIEISNRKIIDKNVSEPRLLVSVVTPIQVLMNTYTLEQIVKEKMEAVKTRRKPRDVFDLWYVAGVLRQPWQAPATDYTTLELKRELNKMLPRNLYSVIEQLKYEGK